MNLRLNCWHLHQADIRLGQRNSLNTFGQTAAACRLVSAPHTSIVFFALYFRSNLFSEMNVGPIGRKLGETGRKQKRTPKRRVSLHDGKNDQAQLERNEPAYKTTLAVISWEFSPKRTTTTTASSHTCSVIREMKVHRSRDARYRPYLSAFNHCVSLVAGDVAAGRWAGVDFESQLLFICIFHCRIE